MTRRLLLLGSTAVVLGALLWMDRGGPPPPPEAAVPPAVNQPSDRRSEAGATQAQAMLNPLERLDAGSFSAMLERPLFNPGRAPRPAEPPPEPPPPPVEAAPEMPPQELGPRAEDFSLVAIAAGPSGGVAAVRIAATGEMLYLREGQPILEWTVLTVGNRSVVIGTPESKVELGLFDSDAPQAAEVVQETMPPGDDAGISPDLQSGPSVDTEQMD